MHLADAFIQSDLQCIQVIHFFCQYVCSLGIEPTTFALLTQCSTTEPQEHPLGNNCKVRSVTEPFKWFLNDQVVDWYLLGAPSSYGWMMTTLTLMEVRSRSIICSWVSVATATLQISTSRLPCRKPAFHAYPNGSTSATMPSKLTWKPSWPRPFLRKVISVVSQPRVTIWSKTESEREIRLCISQTISHKKHHTSSENPH